MRCEPEERVRKVGKERLGNEGDQNQRKRKREGREGGVENDFDPSPKNGKGLGRREKGTSHGGLKRMTEPT